MQFGKFEKFGIENLKNYKLRNFDWKSHSKKFNLENSKNFQFRIIFQKLAVLKIREIWNLKNSKNRKFWNFEKFPIWKIPKITNFKISHDLKNSKN